MTTETAKRDGADEYAWAQARWRIAQSIGRKDQPVIGEGEWYWSLEGQVWLPRAVTIHPRPIFREEAGHG